MANDDVIRLRLALDEATVTQTENRIRNLVNRLNNQSARFRIEVVNLDVVNRQLDQLQARIQQLQNATISINSNSGLTETQQTYRLETQRLAVQNRLALARERTAQSENRALTAMYGQNRTLNVTADVTHQINNNVQEMGTHANNFISYLENGIRYILVYRTLFEIINQIGAAISEMKNVDTALISVRKTTGMSEAEIESIRKSSYGTATEYGRNASEYLESVSEFARAGYTDQSTELGKVSLLTQNVGEVSADSANQMLLAIDKSYQLQGNISELTRVVDGLNNIANKNPTSMQKMADGLSVSASMAKVAGLEVSELIGLVGTGTAVTQREGAEVARAIRTVIMNIREQKGELEDGTVIDDESIAKASKALQGVNIKTKEVVNGVRELRNPMAILDELAGKWSTLNSEAQSVVLEGLANKRQANVLAALLENWEMVEKMQTEFFDSANLSIKENELYLEGWEAKSAQVSAKWTEFVSNIANTDLIKGSLDTLFVAIDMLDTPLGRVVTQAVLINTVLALAGRLWTAIRARSLVADILSMGVAEGQLGYAIQATTGHLLRQAAAWAMTPFGMVTIAVGAISLITNAVEKYNESLREAATASTEQAEKSSENVAQMLELKAQLVEGATSTDELTNALKEQLLQMGYTETEIDNLIEKYGGLAGAMDEATRKALEKAKTDAFADVATTSDLLENEAKGNSNVAVTYAQNPILASQIREMLEDSPAILDGGVYRLDKNANAEDIYTYYNALKNISRLIQETASETDNKSLLSLDAMSKSTYKMVTDSINALSDAADKYGSAVGRLHQADAQLELSNYLKTNSIKSKDDFDEYVKSIQDNTDYSNEYKDVLTDVANKAFPQFTKQAQNAAETVDGLIGSVETFSKKLDSIQEAHQTAEAAIAEYNKQGYLSLDTYQKLMELEPEFLSMLVDENGNLNLNSEAIDKNTSALIENTSVKAAQNLIDKVSSLQGETEQLELLTGATAENTDALWDNIYAQLAAAEAVSSPAVVEALTARINAIKGMAEAAKKGIGKGGLSKDSENAKESLKALKASIEEGELALQKFNDELERLSTLEDLTFEGDYISKIQNVADKLNATTKQASALRSEIARLTNITPANADEAAEIANQVESLSKDYIEAQENAVQFRREVTTATTEAYAEISKHVTDGSSEALEYIERLKETTEQGSFLGSRYSQTFVPTGRDDALSRERKENELLIAEEKHYQDTVLELKKKANDMAHSEAKATSAEIASTVSTTNNELEQEQKETNENTTEELKSDNAQKTMAIQSFFDWCKTQFSTFADWVKANPIKVPKIDFGETEKSFQLFSDRFSGFVSNGETDIVKAASRYAGTSYVWGGDSLAKGGLDCSGFVYNVLNDIGFKVGRTNADGYRSIGNEVEKSDMQYGDLLFFGKGNEATHIAIYAGDGKMWESTGDSNNTIWNPGKGVTLSNVSKRKDLMEVRRLPQFATGTKDYGVACENYKKEFAINKKTGQWHEINEPTLFNKSEYDIVGEKVSEKIDNPIPMFEKGTLGDLDIVNALPKLSVEQLEKVLSDSRWSGGIMNASHAQAIYDAQMETGLSALAILAIGALESGWGKSNIAKAKNNLWGYGAINSNPMGGAHSYTSMESAAKEYATELLKDYYNGYGAKTINQIGTGNNPSGVGYAYYDNGAINTSWATNVGNIMESLYDIAGNTGFTTSTTTSTTAEISHTAEIENFVKEVINRFDEEFISARNELAVIADEKQTENHLKYEEWLKNSPNDFSALESILSEGVENFDTFSKSVNELSIDSYQGQIGELKGIKDSLVDLYNNAETATEKNAILEQIAVVDDSLAEINSNLISIYDSERERLANSVEAIGRRSEGEYEVGISFLEKDAERLQDEIDNSINALEQYEKSLSLSDNYKKQSEMHLQTAKDYHSRADELRADEDYADIFDKYKVDEIFDADGEFNQLYYDYLTTMPEDEVEKFRTVAETMQLLKKGYVDSTKAAADLAKQVDKTFNDAKLKKVEKFVELQDRLTDVLNFEIKMNDSITSAKEQMYDFQNTLREEQNSINTLLKANMHLEGWLDEDTREQLFNLNDYKAEMRTIKQLQYESEKLYRNYRAEINSLTEEEAWKEAEITAEYNKQVETLKDKLSIAKQELDVAKKEAALENALKERDTQIIMGNRMVNVHDPDDMYNEAQELSESELELDNQKTISIQNEDIREMQRDTQLIESERAAIQNRIEMISSMADTEKAVLADFIGTMFEITSMLENITFSNPFYIVDADNTRKVFNGIDTNIESHGYLFNTDYEGIINRLDDYLQNGLIDKSIADAIRKKSMANHDYKTSTDANNSGYLLHNPDDTVLDDTYIMSKKWETELSKILKAAAISPDVKPSISSFGTTLQAIAPKVVQDSYEAITDKLTSGITASIAGAVNAANQDNSVHNQYHIENIEITNPIGSADELFRNLTTQLKSQHSITNNLR